MQYKVNRLAQVSSGVKFVWHLQFVLLLAHLSAQVLTFPAPVGAVNKAPGAHSCPEPACPGY